MSNRVQQESGKAVAECGIVLIDGPGGIVVSITSEAADLMGRQIISAAKDARHQTQKADASAGRLPPLSRQQNADD